jgi:hypothetical protein
MSSIYTMTQTSSMSCKDFIHVTLEGGGCIGKSERHDKPFKRAVMSEEGSLPFITFSNVYKVISMSEVNFGVESGFPGSVQEIRNQWEWITIFLGDLVEAPVVDTQA